jgi:aminoglycoside 6'-N-acetyltransferase
MLLRPLSDGDEAELRRIHATPEVVRWWGEPEPGFPATDDPGSTRLCIVVERRVVGLIEYFEELTPRYRHATIDVFLDPATQGRGLGTEAVRRVVAHLIAARGHHRITIDPATDNAVAIGTYEKAGFRPVGVMRRYERDTDGDGWHDALLMDLVSGEQQLGDVAELADPLAEA